MTYDWQTWAALAIVSVTLLGFILRSRAKRKNGNGDCGGCGKCD